MEEIVIPDFDDDEDLVLPSFAQRPAFGSPAGGSPDSEPYTHRIDTSISSESGSRMAGGWSATLPRSASTPRVNYSSSSHDLPIDSPVVSKGSGLGKLPNGSSSSLLASAGGSVTNRKPSFPSLKNVFKGANNHAAPAVPPIPSYDQTKYGAPGYPTLKNPFSRFDTPAEPGPSTTPSRPRANTKASMNSVAPAAYHGGKQSVATMHSSQRSYGGRSSASQSSSNFRADDYPPLPRIPNRSTPSRAGRQGSDTSMFVSFGRKMSLTEDESLDHFGKTPAEEALRIVFKAFRESAEQKIKKLLAKPLNSQVSLASALEAGVDPAFDELLLSVANCAHRHARRVVDLLGAWARLHGETMHASEVRAHLSQSMGLQIRTDDAASVLSSRKASAGRYIYHRALINIIRVVPPDALGEEVALNLEHTAFSLFRSERPDDHMHRRAVSAILVEFLGELSNTRFQTVSERFTRELSGLSTGSSKDPEQKIEHVLRGVRHLKLKMYPEDDLELSAEFIQSLSVFFANAHGTQLKCAYADTLTHLLHPVIETVTAEVNHPVWSKAIEIVLQRAMGMAAKRNYWNVAFPLVIVALCVSPKEVFLEHWSGCIDAIAGKAKERGHRIIGMNAFVRLLWVYLNRFRESATSTRKRLEGLLRNHFPAHSGALVPSDLPLEPFVAIMTYVMSKHFDYGHELATEFLEDCVPLRSQDGNSIEVLHPERAYVAVRSSMQTLRFMAQEKQVPFPKSADFNRFSLENGYESSSGEPLNASVPEVQEFVDSCGPTAINVLMACDRSVGSVLLSSETIKISVNASSASWDTTGGLITRKHGDIYATFPASYESTFRVFGSLIDALPLLLPIQPKTASLVNILCRATFSADPGVCEVASQTMRTIAKDPELCLHLVDNYRQFIFETKHVFRDNFIGTRLLETQLVRVVQLWVDVLESLATYHRTTEDVTSLDAVLVSRIESCGLFLLCCSTAALRRLAQPVLAAARDLGGETRAPSAPFRYSRLVPEPAVMSSVLQMYESNMDQADLDVLRKLPTLSVTARHRLETHKGEKLMQKIAESDIVKDGALWAAILPAFIAKVGKQHHAPVKALRSLISQVVIRLQAHVSSTANAKTAGNRSTSDAAVLAEQWRLFLAVLCATMETGQMPSRKDPAVPTDAMLTPALFAYLVQLLSWDDLRFQEAAVYALGSIGKTSLRPLAENLLGFVRRLSDAYKTSTTPNSSRHRTSHGAMWTAAAHVFRLISPLILDGRSSSHVNNLSSLIGFVKITLTLLQDRAVREDYDLQSLRRWFCIVVDNLTTALGQLDSSDRFLSEDVRGAIFKLCYEWCHVGRRPDVAKARESHTLQAAADSFRGDRDRAQYLDDLQAKTKLLSQSAAEAMASLCLGKLISAQDATPAQQQSDSVVEPLTVLRWVRGMFQSSQSQHHEIARKALHALIKYNWDVPRLADEVLHQSFGEGEHFTLDASFFGVVADIISEGTIKLPPSQLACLSLSKLGHPVSDVRQRAFQLAVWLFDDPADQMEAASLLPAVGSTAPNVYRPAQHQMATMLANLYPDLAMSFLDECTKRLGQLEAPRRQATLSILPSFLEVLALAANTSMLDPDEVAKEHQALSNLMYLVVRFSDDHLDDIQAILTSFAGSGRSRNTTALVKFLFEQGAKRTSPDFVSNAQRVIACLAGTPAGDIIFEEICGFVHPSDMATAAQADVPPSPVTSLANLDSLFNSTLRAKPLSQGQIALLFAGELLPHRLEHSTLSTHLPTLLHVAFIHCDDKDPNMRDQAQTVLFQVLRAWISDLTNVQVENADRSSVWAAAEVKTTSLARLRPELFWKNDDSGGPETFAHAPSQMSTLIAKILGILQQLQPKLRQQWGALALDWATSCTIRHLACRSFQVFRILSPDINPRMVSDVLARLSSTIASASAEIQAFNNEVMRTFASVVQSLTSTEIKSYPQIFWCSMVCLTTPYEAEFNEVIDLLSHILDKTNLADPVVCKNLVSSRPPELTGPPPLLQYLLLIGLRSSKTDMMTFDVIRRLTSVPGSDLIDGPGDRLLHGFVAALPWMLHSTDLGEPNEELAGMALDLADIAEREGEASFQRLLTSFARNRFRTKDDFIRQAASLLRDHLGTQALEIVTLLLGFVLNQNDWMRDKALQVLKLLLAFPEARAPLTPHSRELVRPLLRLVSTKHAAQALEVLDLPCFSSPDVPEAPPKAIFGSFMESGWSVPDASERSEVTRNNVHAVFNTCAVESRAASAHFSVLKFSDVRGGAGSRLDHWDASQISLEMPSPPMSGPDDNASMGDLVGALHSLNQFFDDGLDGMPPANGLRAITTSPPISRRMAHYGGRASSTESLAEASRLKAIMARGMVRSPSSNLRDPNEDEAEGYSIEPGYPRVSGESARIEQGYPRVSGESARSNSAEHRPGSAGSGGQLARPEGLYFQSALSATYGGGGPGQRTANLYVHHAAQAPSFSSESESGAHDNVFGLDDNSPGNGESTATSTSGASTYHAKTNTMHTHGHSSSTVSDDSLLDTPIRRPWKNEDRNRTPSPRDQT